MEHFRDKKILVTGACGSVGRALVSRLLGLEQNRPEFVVGLDNSERDLFFMDQRFATHDRAEFFVCDICDCESLGSRMEGVDIVFHTAALKHVVLCERSPIDTIRTNVQGVKNVIESARLAGAGQVVFTSSDKAVNPVNVMGASKRDGERLITAAAENSAQPNFASIRFGNVLGSSGSVLPIFHRQIAGGGPVTLTDPAMLRFVTGVDAAVDLIIETARLAQGGEVFVTKMPVARVADIAAVMIRELALVYGHNLGDVDVKVIGAKPGEKLHEELTSIEETACLIELERFYVVLPADRSKEPGSWNAYGDVISTTLDAPYVASNQTPMNRDELTDFLRSSNLLNPISFPG